ncbi:hypothetical protein BCR34DRAFT_265556 [Clohesyomyces aquaticus]|uniref:Uncharacterized protein n=1 Tax=Clohesyomyces aquaticus TaxID=1231657 RepID=A0A1Y1ZTH0_9PLEO|nr:hypothetical protein BCR34DRAFT_265556 [Clohesyomyces aquaticus]
MSTSWKEFARANRIVEMILRFLFGVLLECWRRLSASRIGRFGSISSVSRTFSRCSHAKAKQVRAQLPPVFT